MKITARQLPAAVISIPLPSLLADATIPGMAFIPLDAPYDPDNAFARILRGEAPASRVYEDDALLVIMPMQWEHPGHCLIIPKQPRRHLLDMSAEEMGHALRVATMTATAQQRALGATGFSILQNNGRDQAVGHVHFHVIPDTPRQPRNAIPRDELDRMAERLAAVFPPL